MSTQNKSLCALTYANLSIGSIPDGELAAAQYIEALAGLQRLTQVSSMIHLKKKMVDKFLINSLL